MTPTERPTSYSLASHLLLLMLFAASGCSALIYEIVWYQLLEFTIGSTALSLAVLLATFMGGLCLGSLALPRVAAARRAHPLRVFALLELNIGLCGILVLFGIPLLSRVYVVAAVHGLPAILVRGAVCAICLLAPTMLMGASLPAIARWLQTSPSGVRWLGLCYGANTAGAVFGCLLAGFYLLRVYNMATATYTAVAVNLAVAFAAFVLASRTPLRGDNERSSREAAPAPLLPSPSPLWSPYAAIAASGAAALGAEVVWTRLLGLILGPTVYTFAVVLAVFLVGLALGSAVGSFVATSGAGIATSSRPGVVLGYCQLALVPAIAWTAFMLAKSIPFWPVNPKLAVSPWMTFQIDLVRVIWAILPPTLLWGASFPLAIAAVVAPELRDERSGPRSEGDRERAFRSRVSDSQSESDGNGSSRADKNDPARPVAGVYAANTAGAIAGALGFAMLMIPRIGTQHSQQILILLSVAAAVLLLAPLAEAGQPHAWARGFALGAAVMAAAALAAYVPAIPPEVIAYGRLVTTNGAGARVLYSAEGLNSSIAVSESAEAITFHISGKIEASTNDVDMRMQRMLADVPALLHPDPRSVLVVGFGAGVTAGSFVPNPDVHRIVVCEMEPLVPRASTQYFQRQNFDVLHDRRTQIVYDDARSFILTTPEKFDVVTSDPIHPWVKGSASLYTREYFELVKRHLNPDGVVAQWVPMYETDLRSVKSEIATFFDVFPNGTIWANQRDAEAYDLVLLGWGDPAQAASQPDPPYDDPISIDVDALQARLNQPGYATLVGSLGEVDLDTAVKLLSTYAGRASDLKPWLADAQINRDGNLRLQYLAGLAVNAGVEKQIYNQIAAYRAFPHDLFHGSDFYMHSLRAALE